MLKIAAILGFITTAIVIYCMCREGGYEDSTISAYWYKRNKKDK